MLDPHDPAFGRRDWETDVEGAVRIAVIGVGQFAREYAIPGIAAGDHCELSALVTGSPGSARSPAEAHGARVLSYEEYADGGAADAYDAVYVATPNALHLPHVETAADLGKAVICEKPLEATVERAEALVAACEGAGVPLMTAYRLQTEPLLRRLREAVRDGLLGEVVQVAGAFCYPALDGDPDQWRFDPDLAGGGALYDVGVYPLNTARFLLDADPVAVSGRVTYDEGALGGMDRGAAFRLDFGDVTATCRTSYATRTDNVVTVLGTGGRATLEPAFAPGAERTLAVEREDGRTAVTVNHDELREQFDYFAHAVLAGRDIEPDGRDGLADMRALAAVYESDESGRRVAL